MDALEVRAGSVLLGINVIDAMISLQKRSYSTLTDQLRLMRHTTVEIMWMYHASQGHKTLHTDSVMKPSISYQVGPWLTFLDR